MQPSPFHESRTYVLVHGAYHGGWCWKQVAARLRTQGHAVLTPTQTGLGERAHLIHARPTLDTFVEDVVAMIAMEELHDVVLVGHSFGGSTVSGVADRMPERLRHLVYLDALLLRSGEAPIDGLPPDVAARYRDTAAEAGTGLGVPPPDARYFGVADPAQAEWLTSKMTPQPLSAYLGKLRLAHPVGNGLPATYVACTDPPFASTAGSRERARATKGWSYRELATGHDAMLTAPAELAALLEDIP